MQSGRAWRQGLPLSTEQNTLCFLLGLIVVILQKSSVAAGIYIILYYINLSIVNVIFSAALMFNFRDRK